ncbi:uncharacterized protein LOC110456785 isoform X1 [Mizuhopecten yessoensis]|uniref:Uncharacterized protein n=2 Tax=Mizuhopecten yessoensis TaxID=6573 RepID=A0A210QA87_MIZYE|nr:uncharacterized protein LOC110456785 isoform X1 [Mizuhopecten yessoensis]OWF45651.1 hypothetical protein KP79_PYT05953 [Mizuhopecten yessoensis]
MAPVERKHKKSILDIILAVIQMPRMRSSSGHCCLCVVGVFMFLAGIIMISIGVCLILNYGLFDSALLPPELQNDEGKKIIGIVLTVSGFLAAMISISVSSYYLCLQGKTPSVQPHQLSSLPNSSRSASKGPHKARNGVSVKSRAPGADTNKVASMHSNPMPVNNRMRKKMKRSKLGLKNKPRLAGIQEDSLSRKQSEHDMSAMVELAGEEDTPRSEKSRELAGETCIGVDNPVFSIDGVENFPGAVTVMESDVTQDNSSSESGYTDSVNTGSIDKDDFEDQVKILTQ